MTVPGLEASNEELAAARNLLGAGFPRQAISRAYYAAFYAAEAVLDAIGESRSKHTGVIASFGGLAKKDPALDPELPQLLRALFGRRNTADYDPACISSDYAVRALADAERFVDGVQSWLDRRT